MRTALRAACVYALLLASALSGRADAPEAGQETPPPPREVVYGTVLDAETGKELTGATIAVRTRGGKVLAWGKTDAGGAYRLEGSYVAHITVPPYRKRNTSLLGQIGRGAEAVVDMATRTAGMLVKPVARAAASAVGGPVAGEVAGQVADAAVPEPDAYTLSLPRPDDPGVFLVKVVCPGYRDYLGPVQAYWMDPPGLVGERVLSYWLDAVCLVPRTADSKHRSGPRPTAMRMKDATLEPSIAPRGALVSVSVQLAVPPPALDCVRVLARNDKSGDVITLEPSRTKPGVFQAQVKVGDAWPLNDQRIVLLALRAVPASPQGPRTATPEELAERLSLWRSRKLTFDPQVLASRDREALTLTVVE